MSAIDQIFIKFDLNGKSTVTIQSLLSTTTISDLKQRIVDKEGSAMVEGVRLIYGGKQLSKETLTLADYNIQTNATLFAVLRLLGGADPAPGQECQFEDEKVENLKLIKIGDQTVNIQVKNGTCEICNDSVKMAVLHDNHSICAKCMRHHCYAKVFNGDTVIKCPISCQKEIPPVVAFTVAGLNDDEWKEWELQINKNATCFKECPNNKCGQFIIKEVKGQMVKCPKCKAYDFCWICLEKWKGYDNLHCGNPTCTVIAEALRILDESWNDRINHGKEISSMSDVPLIRICPNPGCLRMNEYDSKCKHMTCKGKTGCGHNYCQACLKKWKGCKCAFCEYQGDVETCSGSYNACQIA
eukprot:726754_1